VTAMSPFSPIVILRGNIMKAFVLKYFGSVLLDSQLSKVRYRDLFTANTSLLSTGVSNQPPRRHICL